MNFLKLLASCFLLALFGAKAACDEPAKKINLVWQVGDYWEEEWIHEVLADVEYEEIRDGKYEVFKDNSIVVINYSDNDYFQKLHAMGYKYGVIQLSDECYTTKDNYSAFAAFVLRNYWHKKYLNSPKIKAFALGYKRGFWQGCSQSPTREAALRKYTWSFAGQISKSSRRSMAENMRKFSNHFVHEIAYFTDPSWLSIDKYRDLMLDSVFVPCPRGNWNLDSFRVYETLECGSIPIVEKGPLDYFTLFLGPNPFITVVSWDEAPPIIEALLADPARLEAKRKECYDWWLNYKKTLQQEVATLIKNSFGIDQEGVSSK